jgi:hypothetical protein
LLEAGITDAQTRVIIANPAGEGLFGDEAPRVFQRMLTAQNPYGSGGFGLAGSGYGGYGGFGAGFPGGGFGGGYGGTFLPPLVGGGMGGY